MTVAAAVERIDDEGVARGPAPVEGGLVDPRPAYDRLHAEAVVALVTEFGKRSVQNGLTYPGAPAASSRLPLGRRLGTHRWYLIATRVAFTSAMGYSLANATDVAFEGT